LTEVEEQAAEAVLPDAKFRCLICGEVRDNRTYIRYLKPEEKKRTVKEQMEEELKHPAADPRYHERRVEALRCLPPDMEIYEFTVCHGLFVKVEEGTKA
jgi:hypothetical protein